MFPRTPRAPSGPLPILLSLATAGLLATGCATGQTSEGLRNSPDVVHIGELIRYPELTVLQFIERERPLWLSDRGSDHSPSRILGHTGGFRNPGGVKVYIAGFRHSEGTSVLGRRSVDEITELRHLSATEATTRYGISHLAGAILVTMKR